MNMKDKSLTEKATAAMRSAVRKVVIDHQRAGRPLAVWENDRVVMKPVGTIAQVKEDRGSYTAELDRGEDQHAG